MKKFIAFLTVLALLAIPVSAMAVKAGDWELVGYTKLEAWWSSAQVNKNISGPIARDNAAQPQRFGRFNMTAQSSRFGLKINGPEILGAKTQGYIEIDFDPSQDGRQSASDSFSPRMRHAWFRLDWPGGWQLLMGQYWGVFCDFYPETVQDGPLQFHGMATQRIPQIRLTYSTGPWKFAGLVASPYDPSGDNVTSAYNGLVGSQSTGVAGQALWGQNSAFPQFQGQVIFEKDLYGKAAFAGRPRGFVADFGAGVQHIAYLGGRLNNPWTFGSFLNFDSYQPIGAVPLVQKQTQTLTPWVVQGTLFIPVLVTHNNNLAGTASVTIQAHIGQGFSFWGNGTDADNSFFKYDSPTTIGVPGTNTIISALNYQRHLTPKYGGYIQGQYYFTNEWYASVVYGFDKAYGIGRDRNGGLPFLDASNPNGYTYATNGNDQSNFTQEICSTLFYTPKKNLKFGLAYSYLQTTYFQRTNFASPFTTTLASLTSNSSRSGGVHSVMFAGWFFF
jgi:hypothetical protein